MKNRLKAISIFAILILTVSTLSSCGESDSDNSTQIIKFQGCEPQRGLIATDTNEVCGGDILDEIFDPLVKYTLPAPSAPSKAEINADVAESITPNSDSSVWTIKLKSGQVFSDGTPIVSDDYIDAWNYGAYGPNGQLSASFFEIIKGYDQMQLSEDDIAKNSDEDGTITGEDFTKPKADKLSGLKKIDDLTFEITLSEPNPMLIDMLGYSSFQPVPHTIFQGTEQEVKDKVKAQGEKPVSNGPYVVNEWTHKDEIVLLPNPNYKGSTPAQNAGIDYKIYDDENAAYADLQAGNLDVVKQVPQNAFGTYKTDTTVQEVTQPSTVFQSFTIPYWLDHFKNDKEGKLRRAAISKAINRETVINQVFDGLRKPTKDFSAEPIAGYSASLKGNDVLTFDPTGAKELWKQADAISKYTGTFKIGYNGDSGHKAWVDAVAGQIKNNLGISAEGYAVATFAQFRDQVVKHEIEGAFRTGWQADYPNLENYLSPLYKTNASSNDGQYSNTKFDALLKEGISAKDSATSIAKFQAAEEVLLEDMPVIPLWNTEVNAAVSFNVDKTSVHTTFKGTIKMRDLTFAK